MSEQESKEFLLTYETIDLKNWNPRFTTRPVRISFIEYYPNLKHAFQNLERLDKRTFNEELVVKLGLPQIIKSAAIFDENARMLLMVRHILPNQGSALSDGLYFELNTKHISQENFEKITGLQLGTAAKTGPLLDYYLVPKTSGGKPIPLSQEDRELLIRISKGPRKIRGNDDKGKKI